MDRAMLSGILTFRRLLMVALLLCAGVVHAAGMESWKFDVLRLKTGGVMSGILLDEAVDGSVRFQIIRHIPGEKTRITTTSKFERDEIQRLEKLTDKERETLRKRIESLDRDGHGELARVRDVVLKEVAWVNKEERAFEYRSEHFVLWTNANEDTVRRAVVRLEDIYGAYSRFLPPTPGVKAKPTRILLIRSRKEYLDYIKGQGINLLNPAFFDPGKNQIVCGTDLEEIGEKLAKVRLKHKALWQQLNQQQAQLAAQFKGGVIPQPILRPIIMKRQEIIKANKENEAAFEDLTNDFFQTLYHEAFHAYLANFVFPPDKCDVPRWLNEGLAQIFETAIVEAGELRIGHVEKDRYEAIQKAVKAKDLIGVPQLLKAAPNNFIVMHNAARRGAAKHYLNSYALAYYLTFDRRILGTNALQKYVQARKRGVDEIIAFRELTGNKGIAQFEKDYQDYLSRLQADGTLRKRR
jgi:hypothetical protein